MKANAWEPVREAGGELERLHRRVALEALCNRDRGSSFETELVVPKTAGVWGLEVGGEPCQWALTQKRTLWGGGALQLLDLRLLEDGGERGKALDSDVVPPETASEGQDRNGERVGVSMGADTKASTRGGCALE